MVLSVAFAYFVDQKGSKKVSLNYSVWVSPARHVANLVRKDNARTDVLVLGVCGLFGSFHVRLYFSFAPENGERVQRCQPFGSGTLSHMPQSASV